MPRELKVKLLLTRGTSWGRDFKGLRDWRVLEMAEEPNLLTCKRRALMSATLTPYEAANVTLRKFAGAEVYMWEEPDYIPGPSLQGRKAVRVVGAASRRLPV